MAELPFILSLYDKVKSVRRRTAATNAPQDSTPAPTPQLPAKRATKKRAAPDDVQTTSVKRTKRAPRPTKSASKKRATNAVAASQQDAAGAVEASGDNDEYPDVNHGPETLYRSSYTPAKTIAAQHASAQAIEDIIRTSVDSQASLLDDLSSTQRGAKDAGAGTDALEKPTVNSGFQDHARQPAMLTPPESDTASMHDSRPLNDISANRAYAEQSRQILDTQAASKVNNYRRRHAQVIGALLAKAQPANDEEILCQTSAEARERFSPGIFHNGPILTTDQQPLALQTVDDFLAEYYDDSAKLYVQDSSVKIAKNVLAVKPVTVSQVKQRLSADPSDHPWNCLELATHVEDGLRPRFLDAEDCRLITKLKVPASHDHAGRRTVIPDYKEVEKWALLAEGGAHTEPHQDSHGYSTYITVNQGEVGFGWMSQPSAEDRRNWHRRIYTAPYDVGDYWRYVVLRPGQTVTFPAGTVHFVFRLPSAGHSLAFGGHFLRCSNLVHWVRTMLEQKSNRNVSNEDLSAAAPGHLERVETFVKQAQINGSTAKWGGSEAIEEFLSLKKEFMGRKNGKKE